MKNFLKALCRLPFSPVIFLAEQVRIRHQRKLVLLSLTTAGRWKANTKANSTCEPGLLRVSVDSSAYSVTGAAVRFLCETVYAVPETEVPGFIPESPVSVNFTEVHVNGRRYSASRLSAEESRALNGFCLKLLDGYLLKNQALKEGRVFYTSDFTPKLCPELCELYSYSESRPVLLTGNVPDNSRRYQPAVFGKTGK